MIILKSIIFRLIFIATIWCNVESAKILMVHPIPAHSHFTLGLSLAEALADKGHTVSMINPYPDKTSSKIHDISVENVIPAVEVFKKKLFGRNEESIIDGMQRIMKLGVVVVRKVFENANVKKLMASNTDFDLIIIEHFVNEALIGLGYHFKSPVVLLSTMDAALAGELFANPAPSSYVPNKFGTSTSHMCFGERLQNFIANIMSSLSRDILFISSQRELFEEFITKDIPFENVLYNVSLLLTNSHPSVTNPNPTQPNVIEIGGFHVAPPKQLPDELQKLMDNSKEGVVLFSMGSNLKSTDLKPTTRNAILKAFSKIKQTVLWKFEADLQDLPKNVKIMKWLPQNDILAHPKVRAFISHGGLLSTIETIYHGVPIIGVPVFGDQKSNVASAVENGYALGISLNELNEENLSKALNEIVNNPKYRENAKRRSSLMHDRPLKPIDMAVYWVEYVIRHQGAPELRSAALDLKWYQLYMIDVIAFLILVTVVGFTSFYIIVRKLFRFFLCQIQYCHRKKNKKE